MKRLSLLIGFIIFGLVGMAQQNYFIYLQTDNKQPFYVKIDKELYSSSTSGYAIIPKLHKGTYLLNIGFPKKEWPEQKISVNVTDDAGYSLKNFNDKGWGLFNLQSLAVSMANNDQATETTITEANDFAGTLANVVNTPSLNEKKVPIKKVPEVEVVKEEPKVVVQEAAAVPEKNTEVLVTEEVEKTESSSPDKNIKRISKASDAQGIAMVYVDKNGLVKDTIQIFIEDIAPERKTEIVNSSTEIITEQKEEKKIAKEGKEVKKQQPVATTKENEDKRFLNMELPNPNASEVATGNPESNENEMVAVKEVKKEKIKEAKVPKKEKEVATEVSSETNTKLTFNSDCKAIASDDDFLKTRKKMASETSAEAMISAAKKRFKSACYSTEQIRNLSVLFLKDETRYNFFDAAYPFVHDTQNFANLVSALSDEYYISRFKAMLR